MNDGLNRPLTYQGFHAWVYVDTRSAASQPTQVAGEAPWTRCGRGVRTSSYHPTKASTPAITSAFWGRTAFSRGLA